MTNKANGLKKEQKKRLTELNNFVIAEMSRIRSEAKTLNQYNKRVDQLIRQAEKRLDEILGEEYLAVIAILASIFSTIFIGHLNVLVQNSDLVNIKIPKKDWIESKYEKEINGYHFKKALKNLKRAYKKRLKSDLSKVKRNFLYGDEVDLFKLRDDATDSAVGHFDFIDRQELHRVFETSKFESAMYLRDLGIESVKTWDTRRDDRVRNKRDVASHVAMEGVTIKSDHMFNLVPYGEAFHPCGSGLPQQDCNCRCEAVYQII